MAISEEGDPRVRSRKKTKDTYTVGRKVDENNR
jgi:hypothetical protein